MLYRIRYQYCMNVQANSKSEAFGKAVRLIREHPEITINSVEQADKPKGNPSLIKRIITGQ